MKIETYYSLQNHIEISFLLEPERLENCYRWMRTQGWKPPREIFTNYEGNLSLFSIQVIDTPQNRQLIERLKKKAVLENS